VLARERCPQLTREGISLRLVDILDRTVGTSNRRLRIKTWALAASVLTIVVTLIVTFAGL
jgi:hypothetical protein